MEGRDKVGKLFVCLSFFFKEGDKDEGSRVVEERRTSESRLKARAKTISRIRFVAEGYQATLKENTKRRVLAVDSSLSTVCISHTLAVDGTAAVATAFFYLVFSIR